ncbi:MAG: cysteine desulfurase [Pirellulaceae bacterium]|jgi:cysteine desulfurase
MVNKPVFMDNQSTTRVDPRIVEAMLPYFSECYGNAGSTSHAFGWDAKNAVDDARSAIATALNASARSIVFTSGATESNNLALHGTLQRTKSKGQHIVCSRTEHKAMIDPIARLEKRGMPVTWLDVNRNDAPEAGRISAATVIDALRDDTVFVSLMLANNEVGVIQPLGEIAEVCRQREIVLHTDATQAVGKIHIDLAELGVDLMSFSAHKIYGPKGVGGLFVRRAKHVRLESQIEGGGQERGLRSGTLNVPGIVGFGNAVSLAVEEIDSETARIAKLRNRLFEGLSQSVPKLTLNGPALDDPFLRLAGNLNCGFHDVDGEALMMSMADLAVSSGSACTSANPEPSHVLRSLGLSDDQTRASLRFGLGRFNTLEEVEFAIQCVSEAVQRLRKMSGTQ